jgi:hypothetical protein
MNHFIEHRDKDQFANGESCRDLRVSREPRMQLMEAIAGTGDFIRFVEISAARDSSQSTEAIRKWKAAFRN